MEMKNRAKLGVALLCALVGFLISIVGCIVPWSRTSSTVGGCRFTGEYGVLQMCLDVECPAIKQYRSCESTTNALKDWSGEGKTAFSRTTYGALALSIVRQNPYLPP